MQEVMQLVLSSGRVAIDLAIYVLLPIMIVMMALMRVLDEKGIVSTVARLLAPFLRIFGIPGVGVFAMLQILFIGFAAPMATFALMEKDKTCYRKVAATFALVLCMSQANAVFPLVTVGLNFPVILGTSLMGGLLAAASTYYFFGRSLQSIGHNTEIGQIPHPGQEKRILDLLVDGGKQGMQIVYNSLPILILAILAVAALKHWGIIPGVESFLTPYLLKLGLPAAVILPLITKFLAGGTAMMGLTLELVQSGQITALELNRIAGIMVNPLDLVGITLFMTAGKRIASVAKPAIQGALVGVLFRGILHFLIF